MSVRPDNYIHAASLGDAIDAADAGVAFMLDEPLKVEGKRELIYPTEAEKFMRALPLVFKSPTPQANIWAKNVCD